MKVAVIIISSQSVAVVQCMMIVHIYDYCSVVV